MITKFGKLSKIILEPTSSKMDFIPYVLKLSNLDISVEYMIASSEAQLFFVKKVRSKYAFIIKFFEEGTESVAYENPIDFIIRKIYWEYDTLAKGHVFKSGQKINQSLKNIQGNWRLRTIINSIPTNYLFKDRPQVIYTVYQDEVPVENLVIDFNFCFLHVVTANQSSKNTEGKDLARKFNFHVTYKTDSLGVNDLKEEIKIEVIKNPN